MTYVLMKSQDILTEIKKKWKNIRIEQSNTLLGRRYTLTVGNGLKLSRYSTAHRCCGHSHKLGVSWASGRKIYLNYGNIKEEGYSNWDIYYEGLLEPSLQTVHLWLLDKKNCCIPLLIPTCCSYPSRPSTVVSMCECGCDVCVCARGLVWNTKT